jgi:hypothetical protein
MRPLHARRLPSARSALLATDLVFAILAATSTTVILLDDTTSVFRLVVLATVTAGSGWSVVGWWDFGETALTLAITLSTGLAILLLVALAEVEANWWHPILTLATLSALVAATTFIRLLLGRRDR